MSTDAGPGIRTAVAADLPALQEIYRAASLSNAGDAPILLSRPEYLIFDGDGIAEGRTLVALAGDRITGFATIAAGDDGPELEDLFVDPGARRRGFARHLVREIAAGARDAGHRRLWVTGNPHARAFYRAAGFVEAGPTPTTLGAGLRMYLDLGAG
jgi:GNAT superfamily N-acetyltransferase